MYNQTMLNRAARQSDSRLDDDDAELSSEGCESPQIQDTGLPEHGMSRSDHLELKTMF